MIRNLKKIIKQKLALITCISFLLILIFMANGYSLLKTKLTLSGNSTANLDFYEDWHPKLNFSKTSQMEDVFFYQIIVNNDSNKTYYKWKLKIQDTGYIDFPFGIDGTKENNSWILDYSSWDNRIQAGKKLFVNIIFRVKDLDFSMSKEEYAKYFLENFVQISGISRIKINRQGEAVTNGNATLTLKQNEEEIKTFDFEENLDYVSDNNNEKQYILNIYNKSDYDYYELRVNMFIGNENTLIGISPYEVACQHIDNVTFEIPTWIYLTKDTAVSVYITVVTEDDTFNPDIVVTGLVE